MSDDDELDCEDLRTLIAQTEVMSALAASGTVRMDLEAFGGQLILRAKLQRVLDAMMRRN